MLAALSGRSHRVLTAIALSAGRRTLAAMSVSHVKFAPLSPAVIAAYVASGEPFGKAGGYAIQGAMAAWIVRCSASSTAAACSRVSAAISRSNWRTPASRV